MSISNFSVRKTRAAAAILASTSRRGSRSARARSRSSVDRSAQPSLFRRILVGATCSVLVTALMSVVSAPAHAACASSMSRADEASASALAASCGKAVMVSGLESPTSTVVANVDGSFTATVYALPVQAKAANGSWVPVSTTLKVNPGGTVSPVASPTLVTLSGGGTGFLATEVSAGQVLTWTWPGVSLPKPSLSGSVATYADVIPGVDLKISVDPFGFSEVLVVTTMAALANPALARLRFALSGSGLSAAALAGSATTLTSAVSSAFAMGTARMWDSTLPAAPMSATTPAVDAVDQTVSDWSSPGVAAKVALVPTRMVGSTLVLTPNASMLADPTVRLPVFIDPTSSSPAATSWSMINKGHPDQEYWDFDRADHAKVGNAGDGVNMYRSMFQFSTSAWRNKHVTAVTFTDDIVHSWSCSNTTTELHTVPYTLGKSVTWNSPGTGWSADLADLSNQNCHDATGVHSAWTSSSLTSAINSASAAASVTIGLRAASETISTDGSNGWKKFQESGTSGPHLSVTYNTAPTFSNLTNGVLPCSTSSTNPAIVSTLNSVAPKISATVSDAQSGDTFTGTFSWTKASGTGTATFGSPRLANPGTASTTIPAADIPAGSTVYHWSVMASDGTDAATSSTCYFKVDNTAPAPPSITSVNNRYPAIASVSPPPITDGVGKPGQWVIDGASDVVMYKWGTTNPPLNPLSVTAGAPITVSYTPDHVAENDIYVQAFDSAGNPSAVGSYQFDVAVADAAVTHWTLANGTAADTGSSPHPGTPTNVTWTPDAREVGSTAATFDGSTSQVTATAPIRTDTSFTVSAWARINTTSSFSNVATLDGTQAAGFQLEYRSDLHQWCFARRSTDTVNATVLTACSTVSPVVGRWYQLLAVYDASTGHNYLYVNGVQVGSVAYTATWNAAGSFALGRRINGAGTFIEYMHGDVSDVQVWDRMLYPSEIAALASVQMVASWQLGDSPTVDDVGPPPGNHPLWLYNMEGDFDQANGVPAQSFDPALFSQAGTTGPVVRTDTSFSVSAWVAPAAIATVTADPYMTAVSQDGTQTSGFQLQMRYNGGPGGVPAWCFTTRSGDISSQSVSPPPPIVTAACGGTPVTISAGGAAAWAHLVGVYDAGAGTITLYINGVLASSKPYVATWNAAHNVTIGARLDGSVHIDSFDGDIDNVRLYAGALTAAQVAALS
jgi:hypothetical protein